MITLRRALWVWAPLALSISVWQCDDSYTANEFTPPDLSTAGKFDFATTTTSGSLDMTASAGPTIAAIAPAVGPNTGSTAITITGTGFQTGATVKVADVACSSVSVVSATSITCTTAGKAATCGPASVSVTNPDLQTASSSRFAYASKSFAFGTSKAIPNGANSRGAVAADFNGDGKPDLANLNATGALTINVQLGNGDGTFAATKTTTLAAGQVPSALAVGDLDNNGALDLVAILTGTAASPQILVLLGQKDGTFKPQAGGAVALSKNSAPTAVVVATADNQAKPYVVVSGTVSAAGNLDVLQNDGAGVLSMLTTTAVGGTGASHLVLADA